MCRINVAVLLAVACLLAVVSCATHSNSDQLAAVAGGLEHASYRSEAAPAGGMQALLDSLPSLDGLRSVSTVVNFEQTGAESFQRTTQVEEDGSNLVITSFSGQLKWATWVFNSAKPATGVKATFSSNINQGAWFAVTDYSKKAWQIFGPGSGPELMKDLSSHQFASSDGLLVVAALAYDGEVLTVEKVELTLDVSPFAQDVDASGGYTSMVIVYGNPAIAYYEQDQDDLRYVRAIDAFGSAWGQSQIVDAEGDTGLYTSMLMVGGNPAIAYHNTSDNELRYVRAADALGENWGVPKILAGSGADSDGEHCSMALIGGVPAVAFYDEGAGSLRYVRASDGLGDAWPASIQLDANNNCGQYASLAEVSGAPCIAYEAGGSADLRYIRAMDMVGGTWQLPQDLDTTHNAGVNNTLLVVNGRPAISFYDQGESALKYMRSNDANGDSWPVAITLDGLDDDRGSFGSMQIINGVPAISYHSGLWGDLRYISANDADGASWGGGVIIDESAVLTGKYTCLLNVAGHPAISYFDQTNGKLRYTWGF